MSREAVCGALRALDSWSPSCDLPPGHAGAHRWTGPSTFEKALAAERGCGERLMLGGYRCGDLAASGKVMRCNRCKAAESPTGITAESQVPGGELPLAGGERAGRNDAPIPRVLFCPKCEVQHIDAPEPANGWTNPPHRKHLCANCKHIWQPEEVNTTGVCGCRESQHLREALERIADDHLLRNTRFEATARAALAGRTLP